MLLIRGQRSFRNRRHLIIFHTLPHRVVTWNFRDAYVSLTSLKLRSWHSRQRSVIRRHFRIAAGMTSPFRLHDDVMLLRQRCVLCGFGHIFRESENTAVHRSGGLRRHDCAVWRGRFRTQHEVVVGRRAYDPQGLSLVVIRSKAGGSEYGMLLVRGLGNKTSSFFSPTAFESLV